MTERVEKIRYALWSNNTPYDKFVGVVEAALVEAEQAAVQAERVRVDQVARAHLVSAVGSQCYSAIYTAFRSLMLSDTPKVDPLVKVLVDLTREDWTPHQLAAELRKLGVCMPGESTKENDDG